MDDLNNYTTEQPLETPVSTQQEDVIAEYYKGQIQSPTLESYRSKLVKSPEEVAPKRGFRIMSSKQRQQEAENATEIGAPKVIDDRSLKNANIDVAKIVISGADMAGDAIVKWLTPYKCKDNVELQGARKELAEGLGSLMDKWNMQFTEESRLLILLIAYVSAKTRHTVRKEEDKKPSKGNAPVINMKEAIAKKESEEPVRQSKPDEVQGLVALFG